MRASESTNEVAAVATIDTVDTTAVANVDVHDDARATIGDTTNDASENTVAQDVNESEVSASTENTGDTNLAHEQLVTTEVKTDGANDNDLEDEIEDDDEDTEGDSDEEEVLIFDADAEDLAEASRMATLLLQQASGEQVETDDELNTEDAEARPPSMAELMSIIETLIFVSEEPLTVKMIAEVLKEDRGWIETATESLAEEFNRRGGLQMREVAGGWQIATRPEHHEHIRQFLRSQPSAKLSLAALETLAVIAYKQPATVPEILEIRGVQSSSAIKTLLEKRLIVAKGRKETIGRPMMYGTSKEFLMQFGLKDLTELPSIEDFEDLAG